MKILSWLNVSNMSNLEADSGYIFQRLLLRALGKRIPKAMVYLMCPKDTPSVDDRVVLLRTEESSFNKYSVRFNFPWSSLMTHAQILKGVDFAIINQPELVSNWRAVFAVLGNASVKMAAYFHYVPVKAPGSAGELSFIEAMNHGNLARAIFSRQLESFGVADYCITCSRSAIELIAACADGFSALLGRRVRAEMISISPPVSLAEVGVASHDRDSGARTILYNHRLYAHYGTRTLFDWLSELYAIRKDFRVLVTDPTGSRSADREFLDESVNHLRRWMAALPFVEVVATKTREEYYDLLRHCYAGLAPLNPSALWSMSVVDLLACAKPVLAGRFACFPEILANCESLLYSGREEFLGKMCHLLDNESEYSRASQHCRAAAGKYTDSKVAEQFCELIV